MAIPISEYKAAYTTLMAARYDEFTKTKATDALQTYFKDNITKVRYPAFDVRRASEQVAPDVILGHQGVRTQITKATQKILDPFYFRLFFDATQLDEYWNLFGSTSISENVMTEFVNGVMRHQEENLKMISRAKELFCSQVLEYGTVTSITDGSVINFKRKAGSMVDVGSGNYWATASVDPYAQIQTWGDWIRQNGKYDGGVFDLLFGESAFADFMTNTTVKERNDIKMWKLDDINAPIRKGGGVTYHGTISCGSYIGHIWVYPQFYDNPVGGASTPYLNPKKVFMLPPNADFQMIYGAVPQLITLGQSTASLVSGKEFMMEDVDYWNKYHKFGVESRPIPVPIAIDTYVTAQVVSN